MAEAQGLQVLLDFPSDVGTYDLVGRIPQKTHPDLHPAVRICMAIQEAKVEADHVEESLPCGLGKIGARMRLVHKPPGRAD